MKAALGVLQVHRWHDCAIDDLQSVDLYSLSHQKTMPQRFTLQVPDSVLGALFSRYSTPDVKT